MLSHMLNHLLSIVKVICTCVAPMATMSTSILFVHTLITMLLLLATRSAVHPQVVLPVHQVLIQ